MARVELPKRLVLAFAAGLLVVGGCDLNASEQEYKDQLLGQWTGVSVFNADGDTIRYKETPPILRLKRGGQFEEVRGGEVVFQGAYGFDCDPSDEVGESVGQCMEFLAPTELFHSERYREVGVRGDTLVLHSLEDDGYSHIFARETEQP